MPRPQRWPFGRSDASFGDVSRDSREASRASQDSVDVDVLAPTPGRSDEDPEAVRGIFGKINSDGCPSSLPGPESCCRGSEEWKRRLDQNPISVIYLVAMRVLSGGSILVGVVALFLGTVCLAEDLSLGGWAEVFLVVGLGFIGLGLFGIYATYYHIWLLFYLFAMVLLWLVAIWLALFLPGYYEQMMQQLQHKALEGGLWDRVQSSVDPDSPETASLQAHGCFDHGHYSTWSDGGHAACWGALRRYIRAELHLDLWHAELLAGVVILIMGTVCSYGIVGPRTVVQVILDGARYLQASAAFVWACIMLYYMTTVQTTCESGQATAWIMFTVSLLLCIVPCCVATGPPHPRGTRHHRDRLKWYRPRFSVGCGIVTYALLSAVAILTAVSCLEGQANVVGYIHGHLAECCDADCQVRECTAAASAAAGDSPTEWPQIATAATPPSDPCDITVGGGLLYLLRPILMSTYPHSL